MITFHQKISLGFFLKSLLEDEHGFEGPLKALFKSHTTILTDSGRGALALALHALDMRGKRLAVPAYLCDVLLPVFEAFSITPVFLDIDPDTFQPKMESYLPIIHTIDGVLLVRTYGGILDEHTAMMLATHNKVVIEDAAQCSPLQPDPLRADARIYSLPKTLPVPDGGLLVLKKDFSVPPLLPRTFSLSFLKDTLKLFPAFATLVVRLRNSHGPLSPSPWREAAKPSVLTQKIFSTILKKGTMNDTEWQFPYCYPLQVKNPGVAQEKLLQHGIIAERIWHSPIVFRANAHADLTLFPHTKKVAEEVLCLPLWQIKTPEQKKHYEERLKEILPGEFAGFGE